MRAPADGGKGSVMKVCVLADIEPPPGGWDEAPTVKIVYERHSCGAVRVETQRVSGVPDEPPKPADDARDA